MILKGKYNQAKVFTDNIDDETINQILELCGVREYENSKIRVMPDCHKGIGCVIGTTMTIENIVTPNLVGVDIGCGLTIANLGNIDIDFKKLDNFIMKNIPSGFKVRKTPHKLASSTRIDQLKAAKHVDIENGKKSIGTLGGGNHFIEVNQDNKGMKYLVVHSGSRNIGKQVAEHYQKLAKDKCNKYSLEKVPKNLSFLIGEDFLDYLHDMKIIQEYADINRRAILEDISAYMDFSLDNIFSTIHNYINMEDMILRKGAVSAKENELLLIPINMRDGILICRGRGNRDWSYSAPHGAGRLLSRRQALKDIELEDFKKSMEGIFSSSISKKTLDEAPMAYKPMEEIIERIEATVDIINLIKPLYNFKAQ